MGSVVVPRDYRSPRATLNHSTWTFAGHLLVHSLVLVGTRPVAKHQVFRRRPRSGRAAGLVALQVGYRTAMSPVRNGRPDAGMPVWKDVLKDSNLQQILSFFGTIQK